MLDGFPLVAMADRFGNTCIVQVEGQPDDEEALMTVVDSGGQPVVVPVGTGFNGCVLRTAGDAVGRGVSIGPRKIEVGFPWVQIAGNTKIDDWHCASYSDAFARADGPLRSMPDFPWNAAAGNTIEDERMKVGGGGVAVWELNAWYPTNCSLVTYVYPPFDWWNTSGYLWRFVIDGGATIYTATGDTSVYWFFGIDQVYLSFELFWPGGGWFGTVIPLGTRAEFDPLVELPGETVTFSVNGYGYLKLEYIGHTFSHQY